MIENESNKKEYIKALDNMAKADISVSEFDKMLASDNPPIVIDLRSSSGNSNRVIKDALKITIEDLLPENLEKHIPHKSTPIVLICDQSFAMTRMVALTEYAYPTMILMGYEQVKVVSCL